VIEAPPDALATKVNKIKILYVDVHLHFINPTNTLSPTLMSEVGDVTFYGPGYVAAAELAAGILRFIDKTGPYDCLVVGPNIPVASRSEVDLRESAKYIGRYTALSSPVEVVRRFHKDVLGSFHAIPIRHRIAFFINFDYYSATQSHVDRLEERELVIIAPNEHFSTRITDLPDWTSQEKHFRRHQRVISDAWYDFLKARPERVITALHFMSDGEFSFRGLSSRQSQVSIPGVDYVTRRNAAAALRKNGIAISGKLAYNIYRVLNKVGVPVYTNFIALKLFNLSYFANLIDTKYAYTAAEAFGLPIRKFFEIPAAGAVLLATRCNGFDRIGFRHGVNCIEVTPDRLADVIVQLDKDPDRAQRIASAGRQLVFERHSISARASQIKVCIESILKGTFAGAEWVDGEFHIRKVGRPTSRSDQDSAAGSSIKNENVLVGE
jgi:glycosyltransferase involved in cell wall biosynthesis